MIRLKSIPLGGKKRWLENTLKKWWSYSGWINNKRNTSWRRQNQNLCKSKYWWDWEHRSLFSLQLELNNFGWSTRGKLRTWAYNTTDMMENFSLWENWEWIQNCLIRMLLPSMSIGELVWDFKDVQRRENSEDAMDYIQKPVRITRLNSKQAGAELGQAQLSWCWVMFRYHGLELKWSTL